MRMIAVKSDIKYDGRRLAVGEEFEADPRHVTLLTVSGAAKMAGRQEYETRHMEAKVSRRARKALS